MNDNFKMIAKTFYGFEEILSKEFKFVELVGGLLGFLIGWIQVAIYFYLPPAG